MRHIQHRQRGAALLVALIILIMVTLLAITASRFTLLSTRSSMNFQLHNTAFQSAEIAVSQAIDFIGSGFAHPEHFPKDPQTGEPTSLAETHTSVANSIFPSTLSFTIEPPELVIDGGNSLGEGRGLTQKYRYVLVGSATVDDHNAVSSIEKGISTELISN